MARKLPKSEYMRLQRKATIAMKRHIQEELRQGPEPPPVGQPMPVPPPLPPLQPKVMPPPLQPILEPAVQISSHQAAYLRRLINERVRRRHEALRIFQPLPVQELFHASKAKIRVLRGSNRSGKTMTSAVEVARAVTGRDPHHKFPEKNGRCYVIGRDLKHIGETMFIYLYKPGAFKMIRDEVTKQWRAYHPWDPADAAREKEARKSAPLIPRRLVKSIAWENKAKCIPSKMTLKNGWELDFFSSDAKPRRGVDIDLWWIDEELVDETWYSELTARILDRKGRGIWSATPQTGNDALLALSERAEEEAQNEEPAVQEFIPLLMENPHVPAKEKAEFIKGLSDADIDVRVHGEFAQHQRRVFPEWDKSRHSCQFFNVPNHYTRYAFVDPGRQVCAVLFAAIPPKVDASDPAAGDFIYVYDELYIKNCNADMFGQKMMLKCSAIQFQAFIIDIHGGKLTDIGGGTSVESQYSKALVKYRVKSKQSGFGFFPSDDDVDGGIEMVRGLLNFRDDGKSKLRVMLERVPNFAREIERYRNQIIKGVIIDKPEARGNVHQMANLRYLACFQPRFKKPSPVENKPKGGALGAFKAKQKRIRDKNGPERILLGPGQWKGERG